MTIKETEGHGRFDGFNIGPKLSNISVCRFHFPKFPLNRTELIIGVSKDMDEEIIKKRKEDLNKIVKFLIRQTCDDKGNYGVESSNLKNLNFFEFLYKAGMFKT